MLNTNLLPLLTLPLLVSSAVLQQQPQQQQQPLPHQPEHSQISSQNHNKGHHDLKTQFRPILRPDLPSITTLILEAFTPWPTWKYLMPSYEEHKAEVWENMFLQLQHAYERFEKVDVGVADGKREMGRVITVSKRDFDKQSGLAREDDDEYEDESESEGEQVAVSIALWQVLTHSSSSGTASSLLNPNLLFPFPLPFTTDITTTSSQLPPYTNLTRATHFNRFMSPMMDKYILSAYPRQLYLHLLATHPSWDGNGFGARQVQWGEDFSKRLAKEGESELGADGGKEEKGIPLTLMATPVGWENLYEDMGFEGLRNVTYEMLDGEGELWWEVGRWGYEGHGGGTYFGR